MIEKRRYVGGGIFITEWLIAINTDPFLKDYTYNIKDVMIKFEQFDQSQRRAGKVIHCEVGDIVFIYITKPHNKIWYKCVVKEVNKENCSPDDEYVYNPTGYMEQGPFMTLKLEQDLRKEEYTYDYLKKEGFIKGTRIHGNKVNGLEEHMRKNVW